jgi:hypothetical protein
VVVLNRENHSYIEFSNCTKSVELMIHLISRVTYGYGLLDRLPLVNFINGLIMPHQHIANQVAHQGTPLWAKFIYGFIILCFFPPLGRPILFTIGVLIRFSINYLIVRPINIFLRFIIHKIKLGRGNSPTIKNKNMNIA